jgi:hypothetical protein
MDVDIISGFQRIKNCLQLEGGGSIFQDFFGRRE